MAAFTTWTRLQPWPHEELDAALRAAVYDPAWLLARQWQLGEFAGEDGGSPIALSSQVSSLPLVACRVRGNLVDLDGLPIQAVVGAAPAAAMSPLASAEAGVELLDRLAFHGCSADTLQHLVRTFPFECPPSATESDGGYLLTLFAGRLLDGARIAERLQACDLAQGPPPELGVPPADGAALAAAASDWLAWLETLALGRRRGAADAWSDDRLEHQFSIVAASAEGRVELPSGSWHGEPVDWFHFDAVAPSAVARPAMPAPSPAATVPAHLSFPGMPVARFWQFEDARVNLARVQVAAHDLARMLAIGFACVYGNDWYLFPLDLAVGSLHVLSLVVRDTFGEAVEVQPFAAASPWDGFALFRSVVSSAAADGQLLDGLLLVAGAQPLSSPPVERVRLFRDEMANLAWAVEVSLEGPDGRAVEQVASARDSSIPDAAPSSASDALRYRLQSPVPAHWLPLVLDPSDPQWFRLLGEPGGRILRPGMMLHREEVPPEGVEVTRRHQLVRAPDGRVALWLGRRKSVGEPVSASGLQFDEAVPASRRDA